MVDINFSEFVYRPAEDTYLMLDNISCGRRVLEIGSGTGIIAINIAYSHDVTATDISPDAIKLINENAKLNNVKLKVIKSDLFEAINGLYDTILFNPPYLPVENEDIQWSGGKDGFETTGKFLDSAYRFLEDDGNIYIILSDLTDIAWLENKYSIYRFKEIKSMKFDFETIYLYELKVRK
ncbi:MAG: methyltransferase [Ferroplasma sp.]